MEYMILMSPPAARAWLIFNLERGAYWKSTRRSYTRVVIEAGRFTTAEALEIVGRANTLAAPKELMQPAPEVLARLRHANGRKPPADLRKWLR